MGSRERLFALLQHLNHSSSRYPWTRITHGFSQASYHQRVEKAPQIIAEPRVALYDEKVRISLKGFQQSEKVTLHGHFCQGKQNVIFASCGQYLADNEGNVNVWDQPSHGGTYSGIEPMGLVWSLKTAPGQPKHMRMTINVTDKPSVITLNVYRGHLDLEDIYATEDALPESLAEVQLERWFRFPDKVTRTEIHSGNVRGALFLPEGDGPFQGVIDLFGSSGGIIEYRSALLASRGFAAFSLPYFKYKDLPNDLSDVTYDYFEEAVEWFRSHPKICKGGIGVMGVSKGAEFALCMSAFSKWIKAAVIINGNTFFGLSDFHYRGQILFKGASFMFNAIDFTEEGAADLHKCFEPPSEFIPGWQNDAKLLCLVSEDDYQYDKNVFKLFYEACPEEKKKNIEIVGYIGAGHLLEPPYTSLCRTAINKTYGILMLFGGQPKEHAHAQEDAWQRTLDHLGKNIPKS